MSRLLQGFIGPEYADIVISLIRIGVWAILALAALKIVDAALRRLKLLVPPGDLLRSDRVDKRTETLRNIIRSVSKATITAMLLVGVTSELGFNLALVPTLLLGTDYVYGMNMTSRNPNGDFKICFEYILGKKHKNYFNETKRRKRKDVEDEV